MCINCGADPLVRSRPPGRLVGGRSNLTLREKSGTRASRGPEGAPQGVRPTNYAECASARKLSDIGLKPTLHRFRKRSWLGFIPRRTSFQPQINPKKQNQQKHQRDHQRTAGQERPLEHIKKGSSRVYSMPEIAKHDSLPPLPTHILRLNRSCQSPFSAGVH